MGLWSNTFDRARMVKPRKEDDLTKLIEEFFSHQKEVSSFVIVDNKEWVVDVEGSVHLDQNDLYDGELWFSIGKLSGNLYFNGQHFKPSVIPTELGGEVIILRDEEELAKSKGQKGNSEDDDQLRMGVITHKSREQVVKQLETALTESLANGYDIDVQEILTRLSEDWKNKDKYQLRVMIEDIEYDYGSYKRKSDKLECEFYISPSEKPLNLSAIEKATYLLFIFHEGGISPSNIKTNHIRVWRKIYSKLAHSVQDNDNGLLSEDFMDNYKPTTLNGYRSKIRKEIHKRISNSKIVDEFAIEGEEGTPFKVQRATDEMRAEIRKKFGLD